MRSLIVLFALFVFLGGLVGLALAYRATLARWYEKTAVFLREVRVEMQKVVWPSKQEVYGATFVVLISVVILTAAIGLEDLVLSEVLRHVLKLAVR